MSEKNQARTKLLQVRLTADELTKILDKHPQTTSQKLSDFVRRKLLDKPIYTYSRNKSLDDFMNEMLKLRNELNAIGNNFNQLVRKLNSLKEFPEIKTWLVLSESNKMILFKKMDEIKEKINQINDQWLRS